MAFATAWSSAEESRCLPFVFMTTENGRKSRQNSWLDLTGIPLGRVKFAGQSVAGGAMRG